MVERPCDTDDTNDRPKGDTTMEEIRIVAEYGTVCGYTGKWLVEHRWEPTDEWTIWFVADSAEEAQKYLDEMPDWAK